MSPLSLHQRSTLLLACLTCEALAASAQAPDPSTPPIPEPLPSICTLSSFDTQAGTTLSHFCTTLDHPDTWGRLRKENVTYSKRGLIQATLLQQSGSAAQPAYKILLWSPDYPHEYASEEPLLVLEPQLSPGTTLDPSGPQYLRLVPGQLLVYVPLLGPQPSLLYRVDLRTHALLQTLPLPICPSTETCSSQQFFLMAHTGSQTRWLLHTWRFGAPASESDQGSNPESKQESNPQPDPHQTSTLFWDGRSIVEKSPPATLLGPTWVAVTLEDDSGRPSVREHYRVGLRRPAGWVIEGCLDAEGNARPEDVFKGTVDISFPEESDRDWHTTSHPKKADQ